MHAQVHGRHSVQQRLLPQWLLRDPRTLRRKLHGSRWRLQQVGGVLWHRKLRGRDGQRLRHLRRGVHVGRPVQGRLLLSNDFGQGLRPEVLLRLSAALGNPWALAFVGAQGCQS